MRRLLAECRIIAGSWVKSKVSKKVSIGFHVSTPLQFVSTIQSSSGRVVIGKHTFLNRSVWTVEEVGIIRAMRGMYDVEEGSSLCKGRGILEVIVEGCTVTGRVERSSGVAMAKLEIKMQGSGNRAGPNVLC